MGAKAPLRVAVEEYLALHGPTHLNVLTDKVGLVVVPAPQAVRERRAHLRSASESKLRQDVSVQAEVVIGTRSLVQKMLWSAARGVATVRRRDDELWELIPENERRAPKKRGRPLATEKKSSSSNGSLQQAYEEFLNRLTAEFEQYPIIPGEEAPVEHSDLKSALVLARKAGGQIATYERHKRQHEERADARQAAAAERERGRPPRSAARLVNAA